MNYHQKKFRVVNNTENGETSEETIFEYQQEGNILTSLYQGGDILKGHLMGIVDEQGNIDMRYHQINMKGEIRTGKCYSVPRILENGKILLQETWEWTSGDFSKGTSALEEI